MPAIKKSSSKIITQLRSNHIGRYIAKRTIKNFRNFKVDVFNLFMKDLAVFEVTFDETRLQVTEHYIGEQRIFRIVFPDKRKPLVVTVAESYGKKFWTSVPQGRQEESEKIGRLIALYFKTR